MGEFRSGVVALAGRANVGKSTLLNRLIGHKVAIATPVPQTTRTRVRGVLTRPDAQLIVVDTPALHAPRHRLGERMAAEAREAVEDADVVLAVFDASAPATDDDRATAGLAARARKPAVAALNKIDRVDASAIAARVEATAALFAFRAIVPISASRGQGLDALVEALVDLLPEGPQYFPAETVTDQPAQRLVGELIREHAVRLTRDELPHSIAVEIEEFAERPGSLTYIRATVHVERAAHKKILVGREGRMLKAIGARARAEIERLLGRRVYLDLWVTVTAHWHDRDDLIATLYPQ